MSLGKMLRPVGHSSKYGATTCVYIHNNVVLYCSMAVFLQIDCVVVCFE